MNKSTQRELMETDKSILLLHLFRRGLKIVIVVILMSGCVYGMEKNNMLSNARNANEAEEILGEIFTLGVTTIEEVANYLDSRGLNCTEMETIDYDPDFADTFYNASIVCWLPAPNVEARSKLNWLDSLVVMYVFRTVFLFDGEMLSTIRVILDDRGP